MSPPVFRWRSHASSQSIESGACLDPFDRCIDERGDDARLHGDRREVRALRALA
jgi:hypothetical protein